MRIMARKTAVQETCGSLRKVKVDEEPEGDGRGDKRRGVYGVAGA